MKKIHVSEKLDQIHDMWTPKIISQLNDYHIKLAKFCGDFTWHDHKDTDEMFYVIKGSMAIEFRDETVHLEEGDLYVVKKGREHKPFADSECHVMLIEPIDTINTGDVTSDQTASNKDWI